MGHLTKENVWTVEQRRGVMYYTLFYICSKLSSMCQKRNNECTIQLTIYIYLYLYIHTSIHTHIHIYTQNHVFPLENVSVEFICIPNGIPVHSSIYCIRNTLFCWLETWTLSLFDRATVVPPLSDDDISRFASNLRCRTGHNGWRSLRTPGLPGRSDGLSQQQQHHQPGEVPYYIYTYIYILYI